MSTDQAVIPVPGFRQRWTNPALCEFPSSTEPLLLVVVDTEEEFDWTQPFSRSSVATESVRCQWRTQEIFDRYGVKPTYLVDFPVATSPDVNVLRAILESGRCQIGAHLHPWVTPPHEEVLSSRNSYPGNLGPQLEAHKLETLTAAIERGFGVRPTLYRAGRYGLGPSTAETLVRFGYKVDLSVVPHTSFAADGGPDFIGLPDRPFWLATEPALLEIPLSRGFTGILSQHGARHFQDLLSPRFERFHVAGIAARLRLLERLALTPEGFALEDQKRLVRTLWREGHCIFTLSYHSPSLLPGSTPYVKSDADLALFLQRIEGFIQFFVHELGGKPITPLDLMQLARPPVPQEQFQL